jgi:hypothetical protein
MPPLRIVIKKNTDGSAALSCRRADGSVTWQRQDGVQGRFFPLHDLTHYAVETELGLDRAFYGLLREGWDITDFGKPWPRGPLPDQAGAAELIVGFFDAEGAAGVRWPTEDFIAKVADGRLALTDELLDRIRARRSELFGRWRDLAPGESLELEFPAPGRE